MSKSKQSRALADEDLVYEAFAVAVRVLEKRRKPDAATTDLLSPIYATCIADNEVKNGGFEQLFWNHPRKLADLALAEFQTLGAIAHRDVLARALQHLGAVSPTVRKFRRKGTLEAFAEAARVVSFGEFDEQYFAVGSTEILATLQARFVREHLEAFVAHGLVARRRPVFR